MKNILLIALVLTFAPVSTAFADDATTTPETVTFAIRDGATLLGPWSVTLPEASTSPLAITPNSGTTTPIALSGRSALGVLESLAVGNSEFSITNLGYFDFGEPYAGGLYLNCVLIPTATTTPACNEWQFSVNGAALSQGAGVTMLANDDSVFLYFGTPRQVVLASATAVVQMPFTVTAQTYDPVTNTFAPATGVTIGVTQTDPDNPWTPIEIATSTADGSGQATFSLQATGSYSVGIKEDYYSPSASLTVIDAPASPPPAQSGGGSSGGGVPSRSFDVSAALAYLSSVQKSDGSFGSLLLSDWAALAFAAADPGDAKRKLSDYMLAATPSFSSITDYERHALALEALGIDPYVGTATDVISPIVNAFDGIQIGDPALDTDDIFAVFPLLHAGYRTNDDLIGKTTAFIVSRQGTDGSWDGSIDVTAAAVQALTEVSALPGVSDALARARGYLHAQQSADGGFGNSFSTSWALQAIVALREPVALFAPAGYTPQDYLAVLQQVDGGVESAATSPQTRIWATEFAIPAALGKTWGSLLGSFTRPVTGSGTDSSAMPSEFISATSTPALLTVATSTLAQATSTPPVDMSTSTPSSPPVEPKPAPRVAATPLPARQNAEKTVPVRAVTLDDILTSSSSRVSGSQTAAVANAPVRTFFAHLWNSIAAFFRSVL